MSIQIKLKIKAEDGLKFSQILTIKFTISIKRRVFKIYLKFEELTYFYL